MKSSKEIIKELENKHRERFINIYDNYFLSESGILYSNFETYNRGLRFIKPSYKINRNGEARPTLRVQVNKKRVIWLQYRLTAHFFKNLDKNQQVNHLDGDVYNSSLDNIVPTDSSDNQLHKQFMNALYNELDKKFNDLYLEL